MKTGANQALIQQGFGADGCYGTSPLLEQVTMILKADSSYDILFSLLIVSKDECKCWEYL